MRKYVLALTLIMGTFYLNGRCRSEPKKENEKEEKEPALYTETIKTTGYSYKSDLQRSGERIEVDLEIEKTTKSGDVKKAIIKSIDIKCYTDKNELKDEGVRSATFVNTLTKNFDVNPDGTMDVNNKGISNWDIDASYLISFYAIKKHNGNFYITLMSSTSRMMFETTVSEIDLDKQINEVDWSVNAHHYFSAKQFNKYLHKGLRSKENVDIYRTAKMPVMFEIENSPEVDEVKLLHPFVEAFSVVTTRGIFKGLTTSSTMHSLIQAAYEVEDISKVVVMWSLDTTQMGVERKISMHLRVECLEKMH